MRFLTSQTDFEKDPSGTHDTLAIHALVEISFDDRQISKLMRGQFYMYRPAIQLAILELVVSDRLDRFPQVVKLEVVHDRSFGHRSAKHFRHREKSAENG